MVADGKKTPPPRRFSEVAERKLRFDRAHATLVKPHQKQSGDPPDSRSQS